MTPDKPGWWWASEDDGEPLVARVRRLDDKLVVEWGPWFSSLATCGLEWLGPVAPPGETLYRIKPLKWERRQNCELVAGRGVCTYTVTEYDGRFHAAAHIHGTETVGAYWSEDDAKAACDADARERMLAGLEPAT